MAPDGTTVSAVDPGGGQVAITVGDGLGGVLSGVPLYVYRENGAYQNITAGTDSLGVARFTLPSGNFKVRGDRLGYQFWLSSRMLFVP